MLLVYAGNCQLAIITLISPLKNVICSNYKTLIVAVAWKFEACVLRPSLLRLKRRIRRLPPLAELRFARASDEDLLRQLHGHFANMRTHKSGHHCCSSDHSRFGRLRHMVESGAGRDEPGAGRDRQCCCRSRGHAVATGSSQASEGARIHHKEHEQDPGSPALADAQGPIRTIRPSRAQLSCRHGHGQLQERVK